MVFQKKKDDPSKLYFVFGNPFEINDIFPKSQPIFWRKHYFSTNLHDNFGHKTHKKVPNIEICLSKTVEKLNHLLGLMTAGKKNPLPVP